MLFNNLTTERRASLLVKNSFFYIEVAKFVQAYTTIVKNPNEFLTEVGESPINEKKQHLTWEQLVKIMQTCDLGFKTIPTRMDLVVYYNYALEMGSVKALEKRIASVNEVAEAQKHYYNFVDEAKTNAEEAYQRQKKLHAARQKEIDYIDGKIALIRAKNWFAAVMMFISVVVGMIGVVSFFVDNVIASTIGQIIPIWKAQYIGAIIMIVAMILLFALFNRLFVKSLRESVKLKHASITIFAREDEMILQEQILKKKLDEVNKDYKIIQTEMNDKDKKFDVKHNIDVLKATNKFYQKLCETDELSELAEKTVEIGAGDDDFAPVKLSKEQEENMRETKKEAIGLAGQLDEDAYNAKFEKSRKDKKKNKDLESHEEQDKEEKFEQQAKEENSEKAQKQEDDRQRMRTEIEQQKKEREADEFKESVDYIKDLLGMSEEK